VERRFYKPAGVLALALASACGGSSDFAESPDSVSAEPAAAVDKRPKETLYRDEVDSMVDSGLGRFLQRVEVEAALDNGKFKGFRILTLYPPSFWQEVDLKPGDVVTRVNGMPIERETQAYDAFVALKKSNELRVSYRRGAQDRTLVYKIVARSER
jgi:type II secretory pathway component PulC